MVWQVCVVLTPHHYCVVATVGLEIFGSLRHFLVLLLFPEFLRVFVDPVNFGVNAFILSLGNHLLVVSERILNTQSLVQMIFLKSWLRLLLLGWNISEIWHWIFTQYIFWQASRLIASWNHLVKFVIWLLELTSWLHLWDSVNNSFKVRMAFG